MNSVGDFISYFMEKDASEECKALEFFKTEKIYTWFQVLSLQHCIVTQNLRLSFEPPNYVLSFSTMSLGYNMKSEDEKARIVFDSVCENLAKGTTNTIIVPISFGFGNTYHTNVLIINPIKRQIERFEPYGTYRREKEIKDDVQKFELEQAMNIFMRMSLHQYCPALLQFAYVTTADFCPTYAPQSISEEQLISRLQQEGKLERQGKTIDQSKKKAFAGYCTAWSMMYAHLRILFPQMDGETVLKELNKYVDKQKGFMEKSSVAMTRLVQNYACYLTSIEISKSQNERSSFYRS